MTEKREPYKKPDTSLMFPRAYFNLDKLLAEKGISQTKLADDLGIRRSTLTGMKTARSINLHYLGLIMKYLNIDDFNEVLVLLKNSYGDLWESVNVDEEED
ncbi:helix-turn-helix transcriptional regulator [Bacillus gobiensis]|uniref:helix-turn-helix domain-containing protein n=1 Tax=Bacillus gobiensis TaxID=1441095 RepID=UPI003D21CFD7